MEPKAENEKKKSRRRKTIAGKSIARMILLGLFLLLATGIVAGIQIYIRNMEEYSTYAKSYSQFIADNIDPSELTKYLDPDQEEDEGYEKIEWALLTANNGGLFREIYIVVPRETDIVYIADYYAPNAKTLSFDEYMEEAEENRKKRLETRSYYPGEQEMMMEVYQGKLESSNFAGVRMEDRELLATTLTPIYSPGIPPRVAAVVGMEISLGRIMDEILHMFLNLFAAIAIILTVGIIIFYYAINRSIIKPIVTLKKATEELIDNLGSDQPFSVDINTNDEIEILGDSFEEMDRNLKRYIQENTEITAEKEHLLTELELAHRIQTDMLPGVFPPYPDRKDFDVYASMDPAKEVGGDFYDFFLLDEEHLGLVMADVSGKGIPAALFMMMAKIMIRNLAKTGLSPKEVLERVNEQICENNNEEMFVTVWLGVLDLGSGMITAVNAGHEYPILKKPGGAFEILNDRHGFVIGGMEGVHYKEYELLMEPGSRLFLYTDGLPEATNAENEMFGTERAVAVLNEAADQSPKELLHTLKEAADSFVGDAPQFDDLTMMCVDYYGKKNS